VLEEQRLLRITVVEDQGDIRELLSDALERRGYTVTAFANGRDAVDAMLTSPPDVALIDIGLPELNGYEVARTVRAERPSVRLIALTGYGQTKDRQAAFAAGFDVHLVKPATCDQIIRALYPEAFEPISPPAA
jgi:two-component system, chemotaxis family, CheB/CheR fusion protein